jgi:hypothetical protein
MYDTVALFIKPMHHNHTATKLENLFTELLLACFSA